VIGAVSDQKPPRLAAGERETLMALLEYQRKSLARKLSDIGEADSRHSDVASGTSLLWLVKHMTRAEALWVLRRFAGRDVDVVDDSIEANDSIEDVVAAYRSVWARVDSVIADAPSLDQMCALIDDGAPANLRWVLGHLIEETARHAGHADILRELIDGTTGR
jgi:uncharacterized damage-inducible protein DinB